MTDTTTELQADREMISLRFLGRNKKQVTERWVGLWHVINTYASLESVSVLDPDVFHP
jgi:hypothetical protein